MTFRSLVFTEWHGHKHCSTIDPIVKFHAIHAYFTEIITNVKKQDTCGGDVAITLKFTWF